LLKIPDELRTKRKKVLKKDSASKNRNKYMKSIKNRMLLYKRLYRRWKLRKRWVASAFVLLSSNSFGSVALS
jgi:hypothetical protein